MNPSTLLVLSLATLVAGQRPGFAGTRPIGIPAVTPDPLADRFGEVDGTTQRLPVEANGDRELIDRLSKLPIDKQPFWFINWQALEAHRQKPQTYPQKPNGFVDPMPSNGGLNPNFNSASGNFNGNSNFNSASVNPNAASVNPSTVNKIPNTANANPNAANGFINVSPTAGNQNPNSASTNSTGQVNGFETSNRFGDNDQDKSKPEGSSYNNKNQGYEKPALESESDENKEPTIEVYYGLYI